MFEGQAMIDNITKVLERMENVSITFLVTLCLTLGLLIFLPDPLASRLSVLNFRTDYSVFIGPAFLLTFAFLVAKTFRAIFIFGDAIVKTRRRAKSRISHLKRLTSEEKGYLAEFIMNGRNTVNVGLDDGVMGGLVAKQICFRSSDVFDLLDGVSYNLQPWARDYLEKNHQALEGALASPMTPREKSRRNRW